MIIFRYYIAIMGFFSLVPECFANIDKTLIAIDCPTHSSETYQQAISKNDEKSSDKNLVCGTVSRYLRKLDSAKNKFDRTFALIELSKLERHEGIINVKILKTFIQDNINKDAVRINSLKRFLGIQEKGTVFFIGFERKANDVFLIYAIFDEKPKWETLDIGESKGKNNQVIANGLTIIDGGRIETSSDHIHLRLLINGITLFNQKMLAENARKVALDLLDITELADNYLSYGFINALSDKDIKIVYPVEKQNIGLSVTKNKNAEANSVSTAKHACNNAKYLEQEVNYRIKKGKKLRSSPMIKAKNEEGNIIMRTSKDSVIKKLFSNYFYDEKDEKKYITFKGYVCVILRDKERERKGWVAEYHLWKSKISN